MKFSDFEQFAAASGLQVVGKNAYGKMGDFPVMVTQNNQVVNISLKFNAADFKRIKRDLKQSLKGIANFSMADGVNLSVAIGGKPPVIESRYQQVTQTLTTLFADHAIYPEDHCPICQQTDCDAMALQAGSYRAVHSACMQESHEQVQQMAQQNLESGSYLLGLLGAVIGGFVGSIPTLLTIYFMEAVYSLLYVLIPLAAYYGYRKLRGKQTGLAIAIICVVSIFYAVIMDLILYSIMLMVFRGYSIGFLPSFYSNNPHILRGLIFNPENLYGLIFIIVGLFISWGQISQTAKKQIVNVRSTVETMLPLHGQFSAATGVVGAQAAATTDEREHPYDPVSATSYTEPAPLQDDSYATEAAPYSDSAAPYLEDSDEDGDYDAYADSDITKDEIRDNELY